MNEKFEVENIQIQELLRDIGTTIGAMLPKGWGVTLFIFSFGEGGSLFYISNADREDMLKLLDEYKL